MPFQTTSKTEYNKHFSIVLKGNRGNRDNELRKSEIGQSDLV